MSRLRAVNAGRQVEPLQLYQGGRRPRRLFYMTHGEWCYELLSQHRFPVQWHVISRLSPPTDSFLETIREYVANSGLPLLFVGDLEPQNLMAFAALRFGNEELKHRRRDAIPVRYLGIDDRWYRLSTENLKRGEKMVTLPRLEERRELMRIIQESLPDLCELVGPRCFETLMAGRDIALHAMTDPWRHKRGYTDKVIEHLNRAPGKPASLRQAGPVGRRGRRRVRKAGGGGTNVSSSRRSR